MFLLRNKKDISIFQMKKAPYLLLCLYFRKFNLYDDLYRCQFNLASIYQRACNYEQAQKFISQACATAKKMRSKLMETEAMYQKAIVS